LPPDVIAVVMLVSLVYQFGLRYVLAYRFTDTRVQAVLFRVIPLSSTRYDRITGVSINDYWNAFSWPALWFANRLTGRFVLIRRSGPSVLITPSKPEEFARELSLRVQEQTGEWPLA
jgi:hypothetical protein